MLNSFPRRVLVPIAVALALVPTCLAGQASDSTGVLAGTLRDDKAGLPLEKATVCLVRDQGPDRRPRCSATDSIGAFRLERISPGRQRFFVTCQEHFGLGKGIARWEMSFPRDTARHDWWVDADGCDRRPIRRISRVFSGRYSSGFEMSEFVPCPADEWFLASDSLRADGERRAWVEWSDLSVIDQVDWPDIPTPPGSPEPTYFARFRGTVSGPSRYGHMGMSAFQLEVDSILELRRPTAADC